MSHSVRRMWGIFAGGENPPPVRFNQYVIGMLTAIHPKLPMRNQQQTRSYYIDKLGFEQFGADYDGYLMLQKDHIQLHFFAFPDLLPAENYGQVYIRCTEIEVFYQSLLDKGVAIHPAGQLSVKPWGQQEFSLLDPDNNLLTFGQP